MFQNDVHGAVLTNEGKIVFAEFERFLKQYQEMCQVLHGISMGRTFIRIGSSSIITAPVLPTLQKRFQDRFPDIQIISLATSIEEQFRLLDKGELDLIITAFPENIDKKEYLHYPLQKCESLLFCVHHTHPLASNTHVSWEQIAQEKLILLSERFNQTKQILREFEKRGLSPIVIQYTEQVYTVERFVEDNAACGFLPESTVSKNEKIIGLNYDEPEMRMIEIIWKRNRFTVDAVDAFIRLAKELYPAFGQ